MGGHNIYCIIIGEEDIDKTDVVRFYYEYSTDSYTTYTNAHFTGPCANGAWVNNAMVNYINFNGKRYP